jgi:hypothetical protein
MVEYSGERRYGIESPLEQSRRHETVLRKVLERLGITGRAGTEPTFIHVVMVHPKGIIHRPPMDKFDTSMVIKADQFATWQAKFVEKLGVTTLLPALVNLHDRNTVKKWGEQLKGEHRPTNPLELPDFMRPKVTAPATPRPTPEAAPAVLVRAEATQKDTKPVCATCGKPVTPKATKFCRDKAEWFGGQIYCYDHQAAAKQR